MKPKAVSLSSIRLINLSASLIRKKKKKTDYKEPAVPMQETQKSRELDPWVGKGMTTHPRLLAWRVP